MLIEINFRPEAESDFVEGAFYRSENGFVWEYGEAPKAVTGYGPVGKVLWYSEHLGKYFGDLQRGSGYNVIKTGIRSDSGWNIIKQLYPGAVSRIVFHA